MWSKVAVEMAVPWRSAEAMHWCLGEADMARRACAFAFPLPGITVNTPQSSLTPEQTKCSVPETSVLVPTPQAQDSIISAPAQIQNLTRSQPTSLIYSADIVVRLQAVETGNADSRGENVKDSEVIYF